MPMLVMRFHSYLKCVAPTECVDDNELITDMFHVLSAGNGHSSRESAELHKAKRDYEFTCSAPRAR